MSERPRLHATDDNPIDRAIDRAVHEMMAVDPRHGLRRRVLARIAEAPAQSAGLWRLTFAAAAVACLVIVVFVTRRERPGPIVQAPSTVTAVATPAPVAAPAQVAPPPSAEPRAARPRRQAPARMPRMADVFGPAEGRVSGAAFIEPAVGAAAGEPPASIPADPPPSSSFQPRELILTPLEVSPLQVAPLRPPK